MSATRSSLSQRQGVGGMMQTSMLRGVCKVTERIMLPSVSPRVDNQAVGARYESRPVQHMVEPPNWLVQAC